MVAGNGVEVSFVKAVEHGYIPVEENPGYVLEKVLLSNDAALRNEQRSMLESIIKSIDDAVRHIDDEIDESVKNVLWDNFESIQDVVKHLAAEIENVREMHSQVQASNTIATTESSEFSKIHRKYESLNARSLEINSTIAVLESLQQWLHAVRKVETALEAHQLDTARTDLRTASDILFGLEGQTRLLLILPKLLAHRSQLTESLNDAFGRQWDETVVIDINEGPILKVVDNDFDTLVSNLESFGILEPKVSTLGTNLGELFIAPILRGDHSAMVKDGLVVKKESSPQTLAAILLSLATVVTYISKSLPQHVLKTLIPKLLPILTTNLIKSSLSSHIPSEISDLALFDDMLKAVNEYNEHLINLSWIKRSTNTLSKWISDAPNVWFSNRRATFLLETRKFVLGELTNQTNVVISSDFDIMTEPQLMDKKPSESIQSATNSVQETSQTTDEDDETDGWGFGAEEEAVEDPGEDTEVDGWKWDDEIDDENVEASRNTGSFPYSLSTIPDGLMEIVGRVLSEGNQLQSTKSGPRIIYLTQEYPSIVSSIFAIWRAILQLERTKLTDSQIIRSSNDALYLSHKLIPHSVDQRVVAEMQRLNQWGHAWFNRELARKVSDFSKTLAITHGFVNSSDPDRSQKCTQAIRSVIQQLTSLSAQYQNVLPPRKHLIAVGELLSSILLYINTSLMALEDISADESSFLIGIYSSLSKLDSLFAPLEPGQFCPEWLRGQYIRELLEWRMVDIMESWREGLLQGVFSKEEMVSWLKRLFQNSEMRARNISEIQEG